MSKTLGYKGTITKGEVEKIKLSTKQGKVGYRIVKLQIMPVNIITGSNESVVQILNVFEDGNILGAAYFLRDQGTVASAATDIIIFDNVVFNQDIYVTYADGQASSTEMNYYLELEVTSLTDLQSTQLTLKSLRTLVSV
jgi:hypothetical protein